MGSGADCLNKIIIFLQIVSVFFWYDPWLIFLDLLKLDALKEF